MRITSAREQFELLTPWSEENLRREAARFRGPEIPSKGLDELGITQRKLNGNFNSWIDTLSDQDRAEGGLWYPAGNDWGHHVAQESGQHPLKVFGAMSKYSPQRDWYNNLIDAHTLAHGHGTGQPIPRPGGISATDNHKQAMRVFDAPDDPDAIHAAFLGTMKNGGVERPRTPRDIPKTHDFFTALHSPETGGAYNHAAQPAVADSWMSRSMLWSKKAWDESKAGGKPLSWPGKGTGQGLDKHLPIKKPNPVTGQWEVVGSAPPTARDVAARVVGKAGGYGRMRQAMQQGAARHGMPFAHGAQAAVWKAISGNANPAGAANPDADLHQIGHPGHLWDEMWKRRASGLHVPGQQGLIAHRTAAHGDPHEVENTLDEGWGTPEDFAHIQHHIRSAPPGWDHWEGRPGLRSVDPMSQEGQPVRPAPPQRSYHPASRAEREVLSYVDEVLRSV